MRNTRRHTHTRTRLHTTHTHTHTHTHTQIRTHTSIDWYNHILCIHNILSCIITYYYLILCYFNRRFLLLNSYDHDILKLLHYLTLHYHSDFVNCIYIEYLSSIVIYF